MQLLEDEGWLKEFAERSGRKTKAIDDWEFYFNRSEKNSKLLEDKKPDIVQVLNEKIREEKEKKRQRKEEVNKRGGEWCYNGEMDEYYWVGEGEPIPIVDDFDERQQMTKEDLKLLREHEEKELEDFMKERKKIQREKRRQKEKERKEAMNKPVLPLPERELCDYEILRDKNVREREKAMAESGFFEDLNEYKKNIIRR